ncbi:MAG: DUF3137 domain-containing protein [Patescibacteria group bacterium]
MLESKTRNILMIIVLVFIVIFLVIARSYPSVGMLSLGLAVLIFLPLFPQITGESFTRYIKKTAAIFPLNYSHESKEIEEPWTEMHLIHDWQKVRIVEEARGIIDGHDFFLVQLAGEIQDREGICPIEDLFIGIKHRGFVPGSVMIKRHESPMTFYLKSGKQVFLESREFNRYYGVTASDAKLAFELLDPHLMRVILEQKVKALMEFSGRYFFIRLNSRKLDHPEKEIRTDIKIIGMVEKYFD